MRTLVVRRRLARGLPFAALFCLSRGRDRSLAFAAQFRELAKSAHDAGSWVPYDITGPLADARLRLRRGEVWARAEKSGLARR